MSANNPSQPSPKGNWKQIILTTPDWPKDLVIPQTDTLPEGSESILESMYSNEHWEWELWREPEGHCYYLKVWPFDGGGGHYGNLSTPAVALTVSETFHFLMTNWMPREVIADLAFERPDLVKSFDLPPGSPGQN